MGVLLKIYFYVNLAPSLNIVNVKQKTLSARFNKSFGSGLFFLKKVNLFIGGFRIDKLCYPLEINIDLR